MALAVSISLISISLHPAFSPFQSRRVTYLLLGVICISPANYNIPEQAVSARHDVKFSIKPIYIDQTKAETAFRRDSRFFRREPVFDRFFTLDSCEKSPNQYIRRYEPDCLDGKPPRSGGFTGFGFHREYIRRYEPDRQDGKPPRSGGFTGFGFHRGYIRRYEPDRRARKTKTQLSSHRHHKKTANAESSGNPRW
jgi:hypothetical protein